MKKWFKLNIRTFYIFLVIATITVYAGCLFSAYYKRKLVEPPKDIEDLFIEMTPKEKTEFNGSIYL